MAMTSRQRVISALNHKQPDKVPVDIGGSPVTGVHAGLLFRLRRELGLPEKPIKIVEPYQMLGEVDDELAKALDIDVVQAPGFESMFGFKMEGSKPWTMFDGTPVLVPEMFNTTTNERGDVFLYPQGDTSARPSGKMPKNGLYFDAEIRQREIDDDNMNIEDNLEEFGRLSDEFLRFSEKTVDETYNNTDRAIIANPGGTALGDIALVPGLNLKDPRGIRDVEEWYVSLVTRKEYIKEVFDRQTDIAVENLKLYKQAVGDKVAAVYLCGADFGTQLGPFCSPETFAEIYLPYYKKMTTWIHENTAWKTFKHCCGSIDTLIPSLIEAGIDILNPVQCSAANMEPHMLKEKYGRKVTFWGAGVDTQRTFPRGTPEEVKAQVKERLEIFGPGGGYVFATIHNAQADVPAENFIAMLEALKQYRTLPQE